MNHTRNHGPSPLYTNRAAWDARDFGHRQGFHDLRLRLAVAARVEERLAKIERTAEEALLMGLARLECEAGKEALRLKRKAADVDVVDEVQIERSFVVED